MEKNKKDLSQENNEKKKNFYQFQVLEKYKTINYIPYNIKRINNLGNEINENVEGVNQEYIRNIREIGPDLNFSKTNDINSNTKAINRINFIQKEPYINFNKKSEINSIDEYNNTNNIINNISYNDEYNNNNNNVDKVNTMTYPVNIINLNQYLNLYQNNINQNYNNNNQNYEINDNIIKNYMSTKENNFILKKNITEKKSISNYNNFEIKNKINKDQLEYIIYNIEIILALLDNYKGSMYLQNMLTIINKKEISILLKTINNHICNLMCSEFGNYFMQKLLKLLNAQQRLHIYQIIDNNFLNIAINKNGTHVIQALIETIQTPLEQFCFDKLLSKNMLLLFNNENGYHIMMKLILDKPENERNNVNIFIVGNLEKIIINSYGAYCVNKFILTNSNINLRILLIKNIQMNLKNLIFNKNSCSVIMLAIKNFGINNFEFIIHEIKNNLSFLCLHPVSYLFVGKLFNYLKNAEYYKLTSILWEIYKNENLLKALISNNHGNKLLKKLMEYSTNTQKKYIKDKINLLKKESN